ncbi:hypothetical protein [Roseovarius sp.]|uniref:hypothetical protein n=1 Tax=Roseovarius sp. TaxID=1486281 RepID=UPI003BABB75F
MSSNDFPQPTHSLELIKELPKELCTAIGTIMIKHAYLENVLQHIIYDLSGVDEIVGRVVCGQPRTSDRFNNIKDLALYRGLTIEPELIKLLDRDIPEIARKRDALAHGAFFKDPEHDRIIIRDLSRKWQPAGRNKGIKKKMHPSGPYVTPEALNGIIEVLDAVTDSCRYLLGSLRNQLAQQQQ